MARHGRRGCGATTRWSRHWRVPAAEDAGYRRARDLEDLARAKGVNATYVSRVLRLMLLAPEIVEAILDGQQPVGLQLDDLLAGLPLEWAEQHEHFAYPA